MILIIVMMIATLLLIALTSVLPSVYQEGQREREDELIFRGTQYGKAVALFHRQFGRYPVNVKELLQTNGMRFLRQEYADPMDAKGKWRFIHVNAAGVLLDSKNQPMTSNNPNPAGLGSGNNPSSFGNQGASSSGGFSLGNSSFGSSNQGAFGSNNFGPSMGSQSSSSFSSSFSSSGGDIQGAYIAGVAATSHHESIKVWNKHHHYDEWEFLGIDMGIFGVQVGMPGGGAGMNPTSQPQQQFGAPVGNFGQQSPTSD